MFVKNAYVPIIKGKQNDIEAITKVAASISYGIKPLIEITPNNDKCKSTDEHIAEFVHRVFNYASTSGGDFFVDFYGLFPDENVASGENAIISGFELLKSKSITVTPVYGLQRNDNIWFNLRNIVSDFKAGFCFRISIDDLDDQAEDTWRQIIEQSVVLGLSPSEIDIIIDLRYIGESPEIVKSCNYLVNELQELVIDFIYYNRNASSYRSITICGSSALKTVSSIPKDGIGEVIRVELRLWIALRKELSDSIQFGFGDYGVIHPNFIETSKSDSFKYINAKIRYTSGDKITYFRGHGLYYPKKDFEQYHALSDKLRASKYFCHKCVSIGDDYVCKCANLTNGPGNLKQWVLADMNHHIVYTATQVQRILQCIAESRTERELELAIENV